MNTATRLASFALGLAVIGGAAAAVGSATDATPPFQDCLRVATTGEDSAMAGESMTTAGQPESGASMAPIVKGADGTRSQAGGLTLDPQSSTLPAGQRLTWRFRVTDCNGDAVRTFTRDQTKLIHLIVVRSDLTGYQHLHPALAPDGTFSVATTLREPGRYRAMADFTTGGRRYVLGTTLTAPGAATAVRLQSPATVARADGYDVSLTRPATLTAGEEATLRFAVTRNGRPVTGLQPYLGAYGHLVALHAPGLEYSHVHPAEENLAAGTITFDAELAKAGPYRLFVQFRAAGRVHTAAFTQNVNRDTP
jgi:hypothetical protein